MKHIAFFIAFMLIFVCTHAQTFINYAQGKPVTTNREIKNTVLLTDGSLISGSLSSLPGSEMYPFNPNGKPRHGEGWTAYNANWNVSLAYLNFYEGVSSVSVLKYFPSN